MPTNKNANKKASTADKLFIVEKIIRKKVEKRRSFYLVKWLGFGPSKNTWEPASSFKNNPAILKDFEDSLKNKSSSDKNDKASSSQTPKKREISDNVGYIKVEIDTEQADTPADEAVPLVTENEESLEEEIVEPSSKKSKSSETIPIKIMGISTDKTPQQNITFLVKYSEGPDKFISREEAHKEMPQEVIEYYERNLVFVNDHGSSSVKLESVGSS